MEIRTTSNFEISDLEINGPEEPKYATSEQELLATLREIIPYLEASGDPHVTLAVMISPAQQLRNAANALERKDAAIHRARRVLAKYANY